MKKSKKIFTTSNKKSENFYIYGKHAVLAALKNPQRNKISLYISSKNFEIVKEYSKILPIKELTYDEFDKILPSQSLHQGFALEVTPLKEPQLLNLLLNDSSLIVILDQVTDPHNVGAILRSAAAFKATAVINSFNNSPVENAIIAKVACGALDIVPYVRVTNISSTINLLKKNGFWCYGLDGQTEDFFPSDIPSKICIIMGSEDRGIRRLVRDNCDGMYKIKISPQMESLNVSTAAAIVMAHCYTKLNL